LKGTLGRRCMAVMNAPQLLIEVMHDLLSLHYKALLQ